MKRLPRLIPVYFLLFTLPVSAQDIYVSPTGNDRNTGTRELPLASVQAAIRNARDLRRGNAPGIKEGIHIRLRGGLYSVSETIFLRPEDSGTETSPTWIEAEPGELPVLSGGVFIQNWKKVTASIPGLNKKTIGAIWVADLPAFRGQNFISRQLWVNGKKAVRAKSSNGNSMNRILNWNKSEAACVIPTPAFEGLDKVKGLELFLHQWWEIAVLRVKRLQRMGDSTKLFFEEPESKIQNEHPWPAPWLSKETGNSAFYLQNAPAFLDEPGEWWLDAAQQKIYYWPRQDEQMLKASAIASATETLLQAEGTIDRPVEYIFFRGISFQHSGWLRPSQLGHVPHQAGMYMTEAYRLRPPGTPEKPGLDNLAWVGRPAAAVSFSFAKNIRVENCRFEHLASTGLDVGMATQQCKVSGNLFKDIGGNGILAGTYSPAGQEIHLPYNPKDEREISSQIEISNNLVTDAANEDWGCVGIGMGYARNSRVLYNEVENVSYTGISLGWGWTAAPNALRQNQVSGNRVHHYGKHNYDCSGIYTLSAQPGTLISENVIDSIYKAPYAHLPSHWFYLYCDEGSSGITVKDNWTPSQKFLLNANGPGNTWANNGPMVSDLVKRNAGLQQPFRHLRNESTAASVKQTINEEHPELIELVVKPGKQVDIAKLKNLLANNQMDSGALYQWKGHYVYFGNVQDLGVMQGRLQNSFPETEVKVYHDMFYEFSKRKHCADKTESAEWEHSILTASLVADKKMQEEYLDAHTTQLEKWPDIPRGFCNADFQQLLLFKNGRQLMLVISIPKGKTLDELNPKTVENNPKMKEWNTKMSKYQEGIEGTGKGEVWVFLRRVASGE